MRFRTSIQQGIDLINASNKWPDQKIKNIPGMRNPFT